MTAVSTRGNRAAEGRVSGTIAGLALVVAFGLLQRGSLVAATAVSEEVCFRGYLMERIGQLTSRRWRAVVDGWGPDPRAGVGGVS